MTSCFNSMANPLDTSGAKMSSQISLNIRVFSTFVYEVSDKEW